MSRKPIAQLVVTTSELVTRNVRRRKKAGWFFDEETGQLSVRLRGNSSKKIAVLIKK